MQRLKEKGPWPSSLQSCWQEGESRRCLLALGSGCGVRRSTPGSPPPPTAGSLPAKDPDGGSAFRPRDAGRWPQPTPLRPLSSRGRRREAGAGLSVQLWGSQLRPPGPGLRLPGSCGSAPSCACAGAARYANCAGSNRGPATPRRARRVAVREWARATPPAGARGYERRPAAEVPGGPACGRRRGGGQARSRRFPRFSPPFPNRDCAAGPRAATTSPRPVSEENFRPQPRWPSGPALWDGAHGTPPTPRGRLPSALAGRGSRSPGPPPVRRKVPPSRTATLTGALIPSRAPRQSSRRGGARLSRGSPEGAGGVPRCVRCEVPPRGGGARSPCADGVVTAATGALRPSSH